MRITHLGNVKHPVVDVRDAGRVPPGGDGEEVEGLPVGVRDRHVHHLAQLSPAAAHEAADLSGAAVGLRIGCRRSPVGGLGGVAAEHFEGDLEGAGPRQRAVLQVAEVVLLGETEGGSKRRVMQRMQMCLCKV